MSSLLSNLMSWFDMPTFFVNAVSYVAACVVAVCGIRWVVRQ